jgi:pyruvate kinase
MRRTKIIATIGPVTSSEASIRELLTAGVDVFRLNFSHGTHESHGQVVARIRAAAAAASRQVAILQDLSGPKIRTGALAGGHPIELHTGDELKIAVGDFAGTRDRISTNYAELPKAVHPGDMLLLDDGRIELRVEERSDQEIRTTVMDGGELGEHKGINAPGVALPRTGLTSKDLADLEFGVKSGVDCMALSFVQSAADLEQARNALTAAGAPALPLIAKLERSEAIDKIEEILQASNGVMVARGDLGLEIPLQQVPRIQKEITRRARALGIPVIVATQVLESMRTEPRPTRAEVSDAANAVDDGVDAIMLAGETAVGAYPVRAVRTLDLVIRDAEGIPRMGSVPLEASGGLPAHGRAICEAAVTLAERSAATALIAVTRGGKTARVLSALRPQTPVYAATDAPEIGRRLALLWGVNPVVTDLSGGVTEAAHRIGEHLVQSGELPSSCVVVLVSVTPHLEPGPSNFLKLQRL